MAIIDINNGVMNRWDEPRLALSWFGPVSLAFEPQQQHFTNKPAQLCIGSEHLKYWIPTAEKAKPTAPKFLSSAQLSAPFPSLYISALCSRSTSGNFLSRNTMDIQLQPQAGGGQIKNFSSTSIPDPGALVQPPRAFLVVTTGEVVGIFSHPSEINVGQLFRVPGFAMREFLSWDSAHAYYTERFNAGDVYLVPLLPSRQIWAAASPTTTRAFSTTTGPSLTTTEPSLTTTEPSSTTTGPSSTTTGPSSATTGLSATRTRAIDDVDSDDEVEIVAVRKRVKESASEAQKRQSLGAKTRIKRTKKTEVEGSSENGRRGEDGPSGSASDLIFAPTISSSMAHPTSSSTHPNASDLNTANHDPPDGERMPRIRLYTSEAAIRRFNIINNVFEGVSRDTGEGSGV